MIASYCFGISYPTDFDDLCEIGQGVVIEDGEIEIPTKYAVPYNPSIVRSLDSDDYIICFRVDDKPYLPEVSLHCHLVCAKLDKNMKWIQGSDFTIHTNTGRPQDPRIMWIADDLYVFFNAEAPNGRRMYFAKIDLGNKEVEQAHLLDISSEYVCEKNWVPILDQNIETEENLFFQYSLSPNRIINRSCEEAAKQDTHLLFDFWKEKWGIPSGGTPPIKISNSLGISFFHSYIPIKGGRFYFIGAYLVDRNFPFEIKAVSKFPIVDKKLYNRNLRIEPWHTMSVVFPGGITNSYRSENELIMVYGAHDRACKYAVLDIKKILDGMNYQEPLKNSEEKIKFKKTSKFRKKRFVTERKKTRYES